MLQHCVSHWNVCVCVCVYIYTAFYVFVSIACIMQHASSTVGHTTVILLLLKTLEDVTVHILHPLYFICSLIHLIFYVTDIIIGVPSLQAHNLDAKMREERCRYLVAELVCRVRV